MVVYVKIINEIIEVNGNSVIYKYGGLEVDKVANPLFVEDVCYAEYQGNDVTKNCEVITKEEYLAISKAEYEKSISKNISLEQTVSDLQAENNHLKNSLADLWEVTLLGGK